MMLRVMIVVFGALGMLLGHTAYMGIQFQLLLIAIAISWIAESGR